MKAQLFLKAVISDPFSQATKRYRITLLMVSFLAFLIFSFGIDPKDFSLVGIRFSQFDPRLFKIIILAVIFFLLFEFLFRVIIDLLKRYKELGLEEKNKELSSEFSETDSDVESVRKAGVHVKYSWLYVLDNMLRIAAVISFTMEFIIPVSFSAYTFSMFWAH